MGWFGNLKITTKFNLCMSLLLIFLFLAAALLTYKRQQTLILKMAVDNARSFARQIIETRDYISSVVKGEPDRNYALVPQVVATQVAKRLTRESSYSVRQVSLRNRNPENSPDEYEAARLRAFHEKSAKESYDIIRLKGADTFRYMLPMVAEKSCLECHGAYDEAPAFVRSRFPRGHSSYNYKAGEIIGAVSVTIPMADLYRDIGTNLKIDLAYRAVIFFLIILLLGVLIHRTIIDPIKMLSATINRITSSGNFSERPPQTSNDEIGQLIGSFNGMMTELEQKTHQRQESEERYRNLIEIAHSPIITFMANGKIIITNRKAERLLGLNKQQLLGESVFHFIEDKEGFRSMLERYLENGKGGENGSLSRQRIKSFSGASQEVEVALSVSKGEEIPLFTAIVRELT
jgi:PAS domain S-box-containing protein